MGKRRIDDIDRHRYEAGAARGGAVIGMIFGAILLLILKILDLKSLSDIGIYLIVLVPGLIVALIFVYIQGQILDEHRIDQAEFRHRIDNSEKDFSNLDLIDCDLHVECLQGKDFHGSVLCEQYLEGANLSETNFSGADLSHARLSSAKLIGASLKETDLQDADLGGADLTQADMQEANLRRANLQDTTFREANLRQADFRDANLRQADFREANLQYADFKGNQSLRSVRFDHADLANAVLLVGNLREACLKSANLSNANLRGANLRDVCLEGAILRRANLQSVINITPEQLLKADSLEDATMPDGKVLGGVENPYGPTLKEWIERWSTEGD